jgi:hypothetical protein
VNYYKQVKKMMRGEAKRRLTVRWELIPEARWHMAEGAIGEFARTVKRKEERVDPVG